MDGELCDLAAPKDRLTKPRLPSSGRHSPRRTIAYYALRKTRHQNIPLRDRNRKPSVSSATLFRMPLGAAGFEPLHQEFVVPCGEASSRPAWRNSRPRRVAKEDELFRVCHVRVFKGAFGLQDLAHRAALRREEEPQRSASTNSACGKNARIGRAAFSDRCR
jgi:hypothetical protein